MRVPVLRVFVGSRLRVHLAYIELSAGRLDSVHCANSCAWVELLEDVCVCLERDVRHVPHLARDVYNRLPLADEERGE